MGKKTELGLPLKRGKKGHEKARTRSFLRVSEAGDDGRRVVRYDSNRQAFNSHILYEECLTRNKAMHCINNAIG